jgi:hypothetical protein
VDRDDTGVPINGAARNVGGPNRSDQFVGRMLGSAKSGRRFHLPDLLS